MKIINIDAEKKHAQLIVDKDIPVFVMSFLKSLEHVFYHDFLDYQNIDIQHFTPSPVRKFENGKYENIAVLLHSVPIYLRDDDTRPIHYQEQYKEIRIVDPLGAYISRGAYKTPYIELYLTKIYRAAKKFYEIYTRNEWFDRNPTVEEGFKMLLTKVLFHELAHAALDIFNLEVPPSSDKLSSCSEFRKWREESMANAVALRIIRDKSISITDKNTGKKYKDNSGNQLSNNTGIYNYAKTFMEKSQPPEYALGVLMEDFDYEDFNSVFEAKIKGVDKNLQKEWLEYVKSGSPNWEGLKNWNKRLLNHARSNP